MTVVVAAIVGFLVGRMTWLAMRKTWSRETFQRSNYQSAMVPTAAGVAIVISILMAEGVRAVVGAAGVGDSAAITAPRAAVLLAVVGFALFGLIDDLAGSGPAKGIAGHMKALRGGELTSGALKFFGGICVSLMAAALLGADNVGQLLIDGAAIALAANLINLFDLRPGRASKIGLVWFLGLAVLTGFDSGLASVALVIGAAAALMFEDLRERLMLGDTGSNAVGAALGVGMVASLSTTGRVWTVGVLLVLNFASEMISFSKIIDRVGPLRSLDQLGRRPTTVDVRDARRNAVDEEIDLSRRQPGPDIRANIEDAHVGSTAGSPLQREQRFSPATERERPTTRAFASGERTTGASGERTTGASGERATGASGERTTDAASGEQTSGVREPGETPSGNASSSRAATSDFTAQRQSTSPYEGTQSQSAHRQSDSLFGDEEPRSTYFSDED